MESMEQNLYALKVPQLKALSKSCKLRTNLKKAELIDHLLKFITDQIGSGSDYSSPENLPLINQNARENATECITYLFNKAMNGAPLPLFEDLIQAKYYNKNLDSVKTSIGTSVVTKHPINIIADNKRQSGSPYANTLHFEESPFYKLEKLIPESAQKIYVTNGRGTCTIRFQLDQKDFEALTTDKHKRLYLLCGAVNVLGTRGTETIQFPSPNELQMNSRVVKANLKGIKNKKGTTKPADITGYLTKNNNMNTFQFIYAFTTTEYLLYIYIVKVIPPEDILKKILKQPKTPKAATILYLKQTINEDSDEDIVTTSTVMSLSCPISYMRMKYPVKSVACKHLQCFDALWFLHSQIQIPTWQCPVCAIPIQLEKLAINEFVEEILGASDETVEQVKLFADGSWEPIINDNDSSDGDSDIENQLKKHKKASASHNIAMFQSFLSRGKPETPQETTSTATTQKKNSDEHLVISLDSDDEQDIPLNNTTNNDSIRPVATYLETERTVSKSLDPKNNLDLSTIKSFGSDSSATFLSYPPQRNPTIIYDDDDDDANSTYSTPLKQNSNPKDFATRHPSILQKQIKFPQYLQTKPLNKDDTNETFTPSAQPATERMTSTSSQSTVIMTDPSIGLSSENPTVVNNETPEPISSSEGSTSISQGTTEQPPSNPELPVLPTLPSVSKDDSSTLHTEHTTEPVQNDQNRVSSLGLSMAAKPIVAPFQPRRNYSTTLPQKRNLSRSSASSMSNES
ncbi:SUMO ligase siz1 [Maudiozyma exigua]|uniref:E3 SUMO-protein transferase SIZ2 n=1 Tax=Maudiozyma exigua TaxID=34358 RepID=A0A9P6WBH1_MAUEX|nr:SUMO ligase siz1 [Kazachstania exigua]